MLRYLSPGDLISDATGLEGDNRVIFRMFINTLVGGGIGTALMLLLL